MSKKRLYADGESGATELSAVPKIIQIIKATPPSCQFAVYRSLCQMPLRRTSMMTIAVSGLR